MAKAPKKTAEPKAPKAPKPPKASKAPKEQDSAATVGPVEGTLEASEDTPTTNPAKAEKAPPYDVEKLLKDQFAAITNTLTKTSLGPKQPRQLRWALKSLEAAQDAAMRHVKHNV